MKIRLAYCLLSLCGVAPVCGASAADALVTVKAPTGFSVKETGTLETVFYSESEGEFSNTVDRNAIEKQCSMALAVGLTTKSPSFEAGYDKPLKTESRRFGNARHWAIYTLLHGYQCDRAPAVSPKDYPCGCTYRTQLQRSVQIKKWEGGRFENIEIDLTKGSAKRVVSDDHSIADPDKDAANVMALAPEIVGNDTVAGIACVLRRQRLGDKGWIDRCITEDAAKILPVALRYRTLSEAMLAKGRKEPLSWSKTIKIEINAAVDSGVFEIPPGVPVKETIR